MAEWKPPLPPKVQALLPTDPFEAWLARQVLQGYDRHWLRRNSPALHEGWQADPSRDLPLAVPREEKVPDRYAEL